MMPKYWSVLQKYHEAIKHLPGMAIVAGMEPKQFFG